MQVADANPLGIGDYVPGIESVDLTLGGSIKGDFGYGIKANTEYNSNFFLTDGDEESDVAVFIAPWIQYTSDPEGGALATFRANYRPTMRFYNDNSDLNNVDQNGDFVLDLQGSRTNVSIFGRYSELTGTDQFTGNFVTGRVFTGGVRGGRQIAPRTSLFGNLSYAKSTFDSSLDEGAQVFTGQLGGLWEYSPRLEIGRHCVIPGPSLIIPGRGMRSQFWARHATGLASASGFPPRSAPNSPLTRNPAAMIR